jgi:glutamate/tyrosine decarboxylase-like PLP-dependent enzyme
MSPDRTERLPDRGTPPEDVLRHLDRLAGHDLDPHGGRMWGYVYDAGPEARRVGREAWARFVDKGAFDPTVYPSGRRLERAVIGMVAGRLSLPDAPGTFTSGGTESILLAVKVARDRAREAGIVRPRMVLAASAHPAFQKAAEYLGLEVDLVPVRPDTFRMDVDATARAVARPGVALVVASASTYGHGVVDPVVQVAALARERGIPCHVDACIGGFILPFFRELGDPVPAFDFAVEGVTSISVDLHKFAFCPRGASVLLFRDRALRRHHIFAHAGWTGYTLTQRGVLGSRSLGPLAASWAVLTHLGGDGYRRIAGELRDARDRLVAGIRGAPGLRVLGDPVMSVLSFTTVGSGGPGKAGGRNVFEVLERLRGRGWYVQPQLGFGPSPPAVHLTLAPTTAPRVDAFLSDLRIAVSETPDRSSDAVPELVGAVRALEEDVTAAGLDELLASLRRDPTPRGADATAVHTALEAASPELRRELLLRYTNDVLYGPARVPAGSPDPDHHLPPGAP